jgi:transcriptional regulator with XRE-family HTH domain
MVLSFRTLARSRHFLRRQAPAVYVKIHVMVTAADDLRAKMKATKTSGGGLARRLGVSPAAVSRYRKGTLRPSARVRARLEKMFGIPADSWPTPEAVAALALARAAGQSMHGGSTTLTSVGLTKAPRSEYEGHVTPENLSQGS